MKMPDTTEDLMARARVGDRAALNALLELYRNYLRLLAQIQVHNERGLPFDSSDLVQETMLDAFRGFPDFRGNTAGELLAWLRTILARNLTDNLRQHKAKKRDVSRQQSLNDSVDQSARNLHNLLAASGSTPSEHLSRQENVMLLANALQGLPAKYRDVIIFRQLSGLSFSEIASRIGCSTYAARRWWIRGLQDLRKSLQELQ
jgi:RNA polymerase sigma-70 factor (ECF subfamily)